MSDTRNATETKRRLWYVTGLRFGCAACGKCCGGAPGYVWVSNGEVHEMADYVGMTVADFRKAYVVKAFRGYSLRDHPNHDCVMLDPDGRCTVYPVRPLQCRIWPFWPDNLKNARAWRQAAKRCPGVGRGPLYSFEQIEAKRMEMDA